MTDALSQAATLREAFDRIEEAYEFMLAYAAQGRKREVEDSGGESQIRLYLKNFDAALANYQAALETGFSAPVGADFARRARDNAAVARSVLGLLLVQPSISSDMVDNTNGLIAMRALLTDIFFIDQAVLPPR